MTAPLVLVAMGIDGPAQGTQIAELAAATGATAAYLQGADPALRAELDRLYDDGHRALRVARLTVGVNAPARSWLTRAVAFWLTTHPDAVVECAGRTIAPEDTLTSPAWERIPGYAHHLFVCRGPRCAAKGSAATAEAVTAELSRRGLGDDDVLVAQSGCLYPCNHAPVVVSHPGDRWFTGVDAEAVTEVVDGVLEGRPTRHDLVRGD